MSAGVIINFLKSSYSLAIFQEPRGVMRILHLVFSVFAFFSTTDFSIKLSLKCLPDDKSGSYEFEYPFTIVESYCNQTQSIRINVASDAQFFVVTGILSLLYSITIILVYVYFDDIYKRKPEFPMADFALTTILAIFWLSGSAAWSNGVSALKSTLDVSKIGNKCMGCHISNSGFSGLNISLLLGFLNFFLWASDLWFLYKETIWFQQRNPQTVQPNI